MATYQEHLEKQAAKRNFNSESPKFHFMGEFLKGEGDTAIVRFPYSSMHDITYTATHNVQMPGAPYGRRIRCTEKSDCELCEKGIKVDERVFIKFLVYTVTGDGRVELNNTIWDRPAAYADIELKALMEEYGDLRTKLFKIKRSGSGKSTRYSILPLLNSSIYDPSVYVADFSELEHINPENILSKSIEQYHAALNPQAKEAYVRREATETYQTNNQPQYSQPQPQYTPSQVMREEVTSSSEYVKQAEPEQQIDQQPQRRTTRYQF